MFVQSMRLARHLGRAMMSLRKLISIKSLPDLLQG